MIWIDQGLFNTMIFPFFIQPLLQTSAKNCTTFCWFLGVWENLVFCFCDLLTFCKCQKQNCIQRRGNQLQIRYFNIHRNFLILHEYCMVSELWITEKFCKSFTGDSSSSPIWVAFNYDAAFFFHGSAFHSLLLGYHKVVCYNAH